MAGTGKSFQRSMQGLDKDPYANEMSLKELQTLRRTLAKRANQRLVRLERAKSEVTGEAMNSYGAASFAYRYLRKQGRKRFAETLTTKQTVSQLQSEIQELQDFLSAKSSTVGGQRDIERKRIAAFERGEWGVQWKRKGVTQSPITFANNKEFFDFISSGTFKDLVKSGFTSEQLVELFEQGKIRSPKDEGIVAQRMQEALDQFRAKGNTSLKELRKTLGLTPIPQ